jgi:hypothetical protein
MKLSRCASASIALLLLTACGNSLPRPTAKIDDTQIIPYARIGEFALGMTEAQMLDWAGEPKRTSCIGTKQLSDGSYACEGDNSYFYDDMRADFENGRAYSIETTSSRYATADGVSVGDSDLRLRAAWGPPVKTRSDTLPLGRYEFCFKNGISADVDAETRRVILLGVHPGGCDFR